MPIFTVVIPTYNREKLITRTVRSVLNQTLTDWELIIVDDGSEDATSDVVKPFLQDKRVKYIRQKNQGAQAARNKGLRFAKGEFICFLDSDDELLADFLQEMFVAYCENQDVGCVYSNGAYEDEEGVISETEDDLEGRIYNPVLARGYLTGPFCLTMRRRCIERIGGWDLDFLSCQDDDICFNLAKHYKFAHIPRVLSVAHVTHKKNDNNISGNPARVAAGWWMLWQKYGEDVMEYCGARTLARHYLKCVLNFAEADDRNGCLQALKKAKEIGGILIENDVNKALANVKDGKVFCYGNGMYGQIVARYLLKKHVHLDSFVVTDGQQIKDTFLGVKTISNSSLPSCGGFSILLASPVKYHANMRRQLVAYPDISIISISEDIRLWMEASLICDFN